MWDPAGTTRAGARRRGDAEAALDHAREAVRRAGTSHWLPLQGEALLTLGSVEQRVGDPERGDDALRRAVSVLNRKGDTALAALAAARLAHA